MDGQKDNDVISTAYRCLLLRPILIVSGAFGQTMRKGGGNRGTEGRGYIYIVPLKNGFYDFRAQINSYHSVDPSSSDIVIRVVTDIPP